MTVGNLADSSEPPSADAKIVAFPHDSVSDSDSEAEEYLPISARLSALQKRQTYKRSNDSLPFPKLIPFNFTGYQSYANTVMNSATEA
ncbi:MAG: hypothetical protein V2I33_23450 [Kangiellaceae bacterium]|nr:hypothetical protein [Kangiellaceae bacterium]